MRARQENRLVRAERAIGTMPIRKKVLDEAWEYFEWFGELPEERCVADAVTRRALGDELQGHREPVGVDRAILLTVVPDFEWKPPPPSVRMCLFEEAVFGEEPVRGLARAAITVLVAHGGKVTDPLLAAQHGFPKYGPLAMHVLGYPERLALPPYEEQARRLFARREALLDQIDQDDPAWAEPFVQAMLAFHFEGRLPDDDLVRGLVLAEAEFDALWRHKRGKDVSELMAAFDAVARSTDAERAAAIERLRALHARQV